MKKDLAELSKDLIKEREITGKCPLQIVKQNEKGHNINVCLVPQVVDCQYRGDIVEELPIGYYSCAYLKEGRLDE